MDFDSILLAMKLLGGGGGGKTLSSISAVYTQSGTVYNTDSLDSLKTDLVVTATYDDSSSATVPSADYTLSGSLTVGTSTITVTYLDKTTTFTVNVSSVWNDYSYSMSNGQVVKIVGATAGENGRVAFTPSNVNRRGYPTKKVGVKPYSNKDSSFADMIYYPIPIPADAISCTVSITPNTQYHGETMYTYSNGTYTKQSDPGWKQGAFTHTFTAGQYEYITVSSKYNSAGSSYPEEPTELTVVFSKE